MQLRWALLHYDWHPYNKGKLGHRYRYMQGEGHLKMNAKIWVNHRQAKEHQRLPVSLQKLWETHGTDPPSHPCCHLNISFVASRTVKQQISAV